MKKKIATPKTVAVIMAAVTVLCVVPFILLIMSSLTDETALVQNGYSFFPENLSLEAYRYLWDSKASILRAYGITITVTVIGTAASLLVTATLAYSISHGTSKAQRMITRLVILATLFNAGLVPTYIMYTRYLGMKNTLFALIFPRLLLNGMNVLIMRTYFKNNIPLAVMESARLDGATEMQTFYRIVLPLAKPIVATIGLLNGIAYWNDWFNSFIYISDSTKLSLQGMLNRILMDIQFMSTSDFAGNMATVNIPSVSVRMAIAAIAFIPIAIAFPFFLKHIVKGISIGAVKG